MYSADGKAISNCCPSYKVGQVGTDYRAISLYSADEKTTICPGYKVQQVSADYIAIGVHSADRKAVVLTTKSDR